MKLVANKASYGFQNKYWAKGDPAEIEEGEKYPEEHFDEVGKVKAPKKTKEELEAEKIAAKEKAKAEAGAKAEAERLAKEEAAKKAKEKAEAEKK